MSDLNVSLGPIQGPVPRELFVSVLRRHVFLEKWTLVESKLTQIIGKFRRGIAGALQTAMMAILHIALALVAAGLVVELFAAATAPLGFQDDGGFHLGQEASDDSDSGNPT